MARVPSRSVALLACTAAALLAGTAAMDIVVKPHNDEARAGMRHRAGMRLGEANELWCFSVLHLLFGGKGRVAAASAAPCAGRRTITD
jgi:hypothetical protein